MFTFAEAFQHTAHVDGILLKFDTHDEQQRQAIAGRVRDMVQAHYTPIDMAEHNRLFKVRLFNMSKDKTRQIMKVGLYGQYCRVIHNAPAAILRYLHEAHFKAYCEGLDDKEFDRLRQHIAFASGGRQPTIYGDHPNPNSKKGSGRGARIGDRNSDYNFVMYKRPAQRVGLELRIMDKACWSRAVKALDFATANGLDDASAWQIAYRTLMVAAAEEAVMDYRAKGIDLSDYCALTPVYQEGRKAETFEYEFVVQSDPDTRTWTAEASQLGLDFPAE